jgi:hypothetical protein
VNGVNYTIHCIKLFVTKCRGVGVASLERNLITEVQPVHAIHKDVLPYIYDTV